jgi:F-type H+-transporting ATPase subunit delta
MANLISTARPYAIAAFDYARDKNELKSWLAFLELAAQIAIEPKAIQILNNPEFSKDKSFELFHSVLASLINPSQKNFLMILAQNKRLLVLPDILEAYKAHYAAYQKVSSVRLVTAIEVGQDYKQKLKQALAKRIEREVALECEVNPSILGGAIIHIGDRVIDGSVKGQLTRLLENLTS